MILTEPRLAPFAQGPVWRASRAVVKRRRVQTFVIGLVVCVSALSAVLGLGLLQAANGPFEHAFAKQNGAHAVADFDASKVTAAQVAATGHAAGVTGASGPFPAASLSLQLMPDGGQGQHAAVVGRARPGAGDVDRVNLWSGRWAEAPGEIVLNMPPGERLPAARDQAPNQSSGTASGPAAPGGPPAHAPDTTQTVTGPGLPTFTVVGYAYSLSASADAWVAPSQIAALHPDHQEMLYRFRDAGTDAQVKAALTAATAGLPADALSGFQSWRTTRASMVAKLESLLPMLIAFGALALAVSLLIVLNVVGGAVVAGYRDIGVYKTIGFTPRQVVSVFVTTMAVPAVAGTLIGVPIGTLVGQPLLDKALGTLTGTQTITPSTYVVCLLGVPLLVALAAYVPARRAAGMSASAAISAGAAPRRGRGLAVQRRLAGTRLPRSVSMGLGLPFARPARSALTFAAVLLGVTTVVFANGLARTMTGVSAASDRLGAVTFDVGWAGPGGTGPSSAGPSTADPGATGAARLEQAVRATPGVAAVSGRTMDMIGVAGMTTAVEAQFYDGDSARMGWSMVRGHWLDGPGQIVVPARFLNRHHLALGQTLTLELGRASARATIVGEVVTGGDSMLIADWSTLHGLAPDRQPDDFEVRAAPAADRQALAAALQGLAPAWSVTAVSHSDPNTALHVFSTAMTLVFSLVAALGVFNTVLLNTRERRRDLGMLKSVGMTPRQVVAMIVTSMAVLGLAGGVVGLPLGYLLYRGVVPLMAHAQGMDLPASVAHVYSAPLLAWMFLAGVGIAVLGAYVPARSAARLSIAEVLRGE